MKKILLFAMLTMAFYSCGGDDNNAIKEEKKYPVLTLNKTFVSFYASDVDKISANIPVEWSSDNLFVATVDEEGVVTAQKVGKAKIIATSEYGSKTCEIEVLPRYEVDINGIPFVWEDLHSAYSKGEFSSICYADVTEKNDRINDIQMYDKYITIYFKADYGDTVKKYIGERYKLHGASYQGSYLNYVYYNTVKASEATVVVYAGYSSYYNHKTSFLNSTGSYHVAMRTNATLRD